MIKKYIALITIMIMGYLSTSEYFAYMDFEFIFNFNRMYIVLILLLITLGSALFMKKDFIWSLWHSLYILLFIPTCIYYTFNPLAPISLLIAKTLFFLILIPFSNYKISISHFRFKINENKKIIPYYILTICLLLFIPYLKYLPYINISNLLFINIYDTRTLFRTVEASFFTRYLFMPLARVLLPVAIIVGLKNKNLLVTTIAIVLLLLLFLFGGLKSIFIGLFFVIIFFNHSYEKNVNIFFSITAGVNLLSILEIYFNNTYYITDYIIRRVYYIPVRLETYYVNYFNIDRYTYWSHNKLGQLFSDNTLGEELSIFVGRNLVGIDGLNANIGFIIEGMVSFGYFGVFLHSIAIALTLWFIQSLNISKKYYGIFMILVYVFNTSFITTLFASHGFAFLLLFSYLFLNHTGTNKMKIISIIT